MSTSVNVASQSSGAKHYIKTILALVVGRLPVILVPIVIVRTVGVNDETDAFFVAFSVCAFFLTLVSAQMENVNVPFLVELQLANGDVAGYLTRLRVVVLSVAAGFALLGVIAFKCGAASAVPPGQRELLYSLFCGLAPFVACAAIAGVLSGGLMARGGHPTALLTAGSSSAVVVVALVVLGSESFFQILILGLFAGELLRVAWLSHALKRALPRSSEPQRPDVGPTLKPFLKSAMYHLLASASLAVMPIIDRMMASRLGAGYASLLSSAERIWQVPISLLTGGVLLVKLVDWSTRYYGGKQAHFLGKALCRTSILGFGVCLPIVSLLFVLRVPITELLFGKNLLQAGSLKVAADTLGTFFIAIPIYLVGLIYGRGMIVLKKTGWILIVTLLQVGLKIIANIYLGSRWGVPGFAAATGIMFAFSTVCLVSIFHLTCRKAEQPRSVDPMLGKSLT